MSIKDWEPFRVKNLPTRNSPLVDRTLGNKALLALGGDEGFRTRVVNLPTGGTMRVKTRNGMPEFVCDPKYGTSVASKNDLPPFSIKVAVSLVAALSDLYMTSGAYSFGPLGGINNTDPSLTVEPVTYKTGSVSSGETQLIPHYEQNPPNNGEVSKIYNHTVIPGGLNSPKSEMYNLRPSEFSGLMRRWMQARYGSGVTSANLAQADDTGSVTADPSYASTTGLLKFGTNYILVKLFTDSGLLTVKWYKVVFQSEVEEFVKLGATDPEQTLSLSRACADFDTEKTLDPISIAIGSPIHYGWNFSLTMNKAKVCVNEPLAYGYDRRMWRLMSLQFSYDVGTNVLSCAYTLDEEIDGTSCPAIGPIWAPQGSSTLWYNVTMTSPDPTTSQDFPVYAFYVKDVLQVVRWKYQSTSGVAFDLNTFNTRARDQGLADSIFGVGNYSTTYSEQYGTVKTHGFYISGQGGVKTSSSASRRQTVTISTTLIGNMDQPNPPSVGFSSKSMFLTYFLGTDSTFNKLTGYSGYNAIYEKGNYPADPRPGNHYSVSKNLSFSLNITQETVTGSAGVHVSALVIPSCDCSTAYIGYRATESTDSTKSITTGATMANCVTCEWYGNYVNDVFVIYGEWYPPVFRQIWSGITGVSGGTGTQQRTITSTESVETALIHDGKRIVGNVDSEIFHPGINNSDLAQQVNSISSSVYADLRYNINTLSGGESEATSGYPLDITLFVGAA